MSRDSEPLESPAVPGVEHGQVATTTAAPSTPQTTTPDERPRLTYQPALDGLRAVAVLAVMAFHSSMPWAKGGEFGVDLFFVLSGFLITTLLLQEYGRSHAISLGDFYARRIRRLFPALILVLAFVALYALFAADPTTVHNLRWDGISALTYWSNWWFIFSHQS
jgi:peptidoglycan/LPS O-acetylase OafA/YrhL